MWMSSTMDGNKQEGKCLIIESKTLKWAKDNNAPSPPPPRIILISPYGRWDDYDITFTITMIVKKKEIQMLKMHEQRG